MKISKYQFPEGLVAVGRTLAASADNHPAAGRIDSAAGIRPVGSRRRHHLCRPAADSYALAFGRDGLRT